jgi:hypothetical protein
VLRLVGRRFGPVLRSEPHDSAGKAMEWSEELRREEARGSLARRRSGRFSRERERPATDRREHTVRH